MPHCVQAMTCSCAVQGAVDDLDRVLAILAETGYSEERFYIHCDGALFGLMVRTPASAHALSSML